MSFEELEDLGHENWLGDDKKNIVNIHVDRSQFEETGGVIDKNVTIPIARNNHATLRALSKFTP